MIRTGDIREIVLKSLCKAVHFPNAKNGSPGMITTIAMGLKPIAMKKPSQSFESDSMQAIC